MITCLASTDHHGDLLFFGHLPGQVSVDRSCGVLVELPSCSGDTEWVFPSDCDSLMAQVMTKAHSNNDSRRGDLTSVATYHRDPLHILSWRRLTVLFI